MTRRLQAIATVLVLTLVVGACDWYQPGFNATNDGNNASETAIAVNTLGSLTQTWEYATAGTAAPKLAVADGQVFSSDPDGVHSIDAGTGTLTWDAGAPDPDAYCPYPGTGLVDLRPYGPVISGGVVHALGATILCPEIGGPSQTVLAGATIDEGTGAETWAFGTWPVGMVISRGVEYTTYNTYVPPNLVHAVSGSGTHGIAGGASRAAVGATRMFATTENGTLVVAPTSGASTAPLWTASLSPLSVPTPSIDATHVYVTDGSTVKAYDQTTGALLWTAALPATGSTDAPAVADGRVFVRTANSIEAIDAATGAVLWTGSLGSAGTTATDLGSPSLANGVVYVGSQDGNLLAFDATGSTDCAGSPVVCSPVITRPIGGPPGASRPVIADGAVFIGTLHSDGNEAIYKFSSKFATVGSSIAQAN